MEGVGKSFASEKLLAAREKTWEAVQRIGSELRPGQTEAEAIVAANAILSNMGVRKFWHRTHIRFGRNTVLGYEDPYEGEVRLQDNDIFYIDIGPVFDGHEGDAGTTFVLGDDPTKHALCRDVRVVFDRVRERWLKEAVSGHALYMYAAEVAESLGWVLNPSYVRGHRISDFPHGLHHSGSMETCVGHPNPERWVLEIQIRHPREALGAFYEDLLVSDH